MNTASKLAAMRGDDNLMILCAEIAAFQEGSDLVKAALGELWYVDQPLGEMMSANDVGRNESKSSYVSHILDALRFARADPSKFQGFVEGMRKISADAEREVILADLEAAFAQTPPTIEPIGEAIPMGCEWPYRSK